MDLTLPAHHTITTASDTSTPTVVTSATVTPVPHHAVAELSSSKVNLTTVNKFQYLISLIEGLAFAAVAGLKLTELNYNEAIDILTKRFGNKHLIICWHMDTLLELDPVASPTNIKALTCLYNKIEFQIRSLKSPSVLLTVIYCLHCL